MKVLVENRKASYDYELLKKYEAGISLLGSEVKSVKNSQASIKEAYVLIKNNELFIQNMDISPYKQSAHIDLDSKRLRKLLCHRHEIEKIKASVEEKGLSCVPTKVYLKKGKIKLEICIGRGKRKFDKREKYKKEIHQKEIKKNL